MTWVSERSGIASSGAWRMDHQPRSAAAATVAKTTTLLRIEKSTIRSIMRSREPGYSLRYFRGSFTKLCLAVLGAEGVRPAVVVGLEARGGRVPHAHVHPADDVPGCGEGSRRSRARSSGVPGRLLVERLLALGRDEVVGRAGVVGPDRVRGGHLDLGATDRVRREDGAPARRLARRVQLAIGLADVLRRAILAFLRAAPFAGRRRRHRPRRGLGRRRREARPRDEPLGVRVEPLLARVRAEEVARPPMDGRAARRLRLRLIDLHPADRVRLRRDDAHGRGLHPALGVEQEVAGDDDALAGHEALDDLDPVVGAPAGLDAPRLEVPGAAVDEHHLAQPRVDDRVRRHRDRLGEGGGDLHVDEHVRPQRHVAVVDVQPDLQRCGWWGRAAAARC